MGRVSDHTAKKINTASSQQTAREAVAVYLTKKIRTRAPQAVALARLEDKFTVLSTKLSNHQAAAHDAYRQFLQPPTHTAPSQPPAALFKTLPFERRFIRDLALSLPEHVEARVQRFVYDHVVQTWQSDETSQAQVIHWANVVDSRLSQNRDITAQAFRAIYGDLDVVKAWREQKQARQASDDTRMGNSGWNSTFMVGAAAAFF